MKIQQQCLRGNKPEIELWFELSLESKNKNTHKLLSENEDLRKVIQDKLWELIPGFMAIIQHELNTRFPEEIK